MRPLISQSIFSLHLLSVLLFTSSFTTPSSSVAWAAEDAKPPAYLHLRHARNLNRGVAEAKIEVEVDNIPKRKSPEEVLVEGEDAPSPSATTPENGAAPVPANKALDDCLALITPPPSLSKRQDNQGQINALSGEIQRLSESFRSVSQASQQVSQSSQQLSQSLQQATQRLAQTEASIASLRAQKDIAEQASRSATQAANDASRRADEASASADRAISSVLSEASRSASEMMVSMAASASRAVASATNEIANSASSRILQAQAEATSVKSDAASQVQQAQGAAVSVTQAALAVVGGIVGGSLLTVVGVVLVLRWKRKKKERKRLRNAMGGFAGGFGGEKDPGTGAGYEVRKGSIGGGRPPVGDYKMADYDESNYSNSPPPSSRYSAVGYPLDVKVKEPPAVALVERSNTTTSRKPGVGTGGGPGGFKLGDPPAPKSKFTLFPSPSTSASGTSPKSGSPNTRGSKTNFPSLDTWLRNGTTVSPFATVNKAGAAAMGVGIATTTEGRKSPEWPIRRS